MSLDDHAEAFKTLLNDALDPREAWDADDIQRLPEASRPRQYVELGFSYRYRPGDRLSPGQGARAVRLTTRYVAESQTNTRTLQDDCWTALHTSMLTIGGGTTTPVMHETGDQPSPDDGMWSGLDSWTYVL